MAWIQNGKQETETDACDSATMNQLYHPERTAAFFQFLAQNPNIQIFTITNNVVHDLVSFEMANKEVKTLHGVMTFLDTNRSLRASNCLLHFCTMFPFSNQFKFSSKFYLSSPCLS